ncbi:hypothetical protein HYALB_00009311 [Hymenoscyphus albidus]|uniref:Protein kinase domain-containing protein n=1 Tax=Hymenoscyphus albidus TaxID=595503 RepID=A0A9N9LHF8_9HELO|nr:hypothetical protein HYALB_00009311 [Hymenoscyphus albidus]
MIFAAKSLLLPVPGVHRTFMSDIPGDSPGEIVEGHFIVMDYISGPTVDECWDTMDQTQRKSVARQVASMLEKMQTTSLQLPPGPIWRTNNQKFEGFWFTDYGAGPFGTLKDLEDWCNHKIDVCIKFKQLPDDSERFVFRDLVLTHQDIAPRNFIIDKDGKVWMIDWGLAGVYPPGVEQAVLEVYAYSSEGFQEMVFAELTL